MGRISRRTSSRRSRRRTSSCRCCCRLVDDPTGKFLKVKLIQKKSAPVKPAYLFDEGATVEWVPNKEKLRTSAPGVKLASYEDEWYGQPVSVLEMDGKVD